MTEKLYMKEINSYAWSTPKHRIKNQYMLRIEENRALPTPNILKYSWDNITPPKVSLPRSKRYSSENRVSNNSEHLMKTLSKHLKEFGGSQNSQNTRKLDKNSIISNSQYNNLSSSQNIEREVLDKWIESLNNKDFTFSNWGDL